jgi:hypothetical protein
MEWPCPCCITWLTQAMGSPNALPQGNGQFLDFVSVGSFGQLQMFEIFPKKIKPRAFFHMDKTNN